VIDAMKIRVRRLDRIAFLTGHSINVAAKQRSANQGK
jgi:hypothetical protein